MQYGKAISECRRCMVDDACIGEQELPNHQMKDRTKGSESGRNEERSSRCRFHIIPNLYRIRVMNARHVIIFDFFLWLLHFCFDNLFRYFNYHSLSPCPAQTTSQMFAYHLRKWLKNHSVPWQVFWNPQSPHQPRRDRCHVNFFNQLLEVAGPLFFQAAWWSGKLPKKLKGKEGKWITLVNNLLVNGFIPVLSFAYITGAASE